MTVLPAQHAAHWKQYPGQYEHWRFTDGFLDGWDDANRFANTEYGSTPFINEIGFKGHWARRRQANHAATKGSSANLWEYGMPYHFRACSHADERDTTDATCSEHGFMQGVDAATKRLARRV